MAQREEFAELVLDEPALDPQLCLQQLGAVVSQHPHDLEPVPPIVEFDAKRFKLAKDVGAVADLDSRRDLLRMGAYEFERLVRELFEAMGYETWRTQNSRDDGLDAVAVKRDGDGVTVVAVQAKRTKNAVPVETVRALLGTVTHTNAARGSTGDDLLVRQGQLRHGGRQRGAPPSGRRPRTEVPPPGTPRRRCPDQPAEAPPGLAGGRTALSTGAWHAWSRMHRSHDPVST
ncbi:restriction endonuclease [Kitasatospora sp. LaBMicrA B282]|uniref:restriction endonuclease n=1 Tax=Kitasatospora sp. LaBMicrA B282 TaxID=3420949 RepID=UPI003D1006C4